MSPNIEGDFKGNKAVYWGGGMPTCAIKRSPGAEDISTTNSSAQTGEGALWYTAINLNTGGGLEKTRQYIWGMFFCVVFFFLVYLYSADTQHGNLHPAVWPILFCGPKQESCVSHSQHREKSGEVLEKMQENGPEV